MARGKKGAGVDLDQTHALTAGLIEALRCPEGKEQAFLRDSDTRGLRVRVTAGGAKSFVFESKVDGRTFRRTLGLVQDMSIADARVKSVALRKLVNEDIDPRELDRQNAERKAKELAEAEAKAAADQSKAVTVADVWPRYMAEGNPARKDAWMSLPPKNVSLAE